MTTYWTRLRDGDEHRQPERDRVRELFREEATIEQGARVPRSITIQAATSRIAAKVVSVAIIAPRPRPAAAGTTNATARALSHTRYVIAERRVRPWLVIESSSGEAETVRPV